MTLALFGPHGDVEKCFPDTVRGVDTPKPRGETFGALAIVGPAGGVFGPTGIPWLTLGDVYDVVVVVTGENFNAVTVRGQLGIRDEFVEPDGPRIMLFGWLDEPDEFVSNA